MAHRTFVFGDIHGDFDQLERLFGKLPVLDAEDTVVFLGDYLDRGPQSRQVVEFVRQGVKAHPRNRGAKIVALRGNHEDGWLRVLDGGWPEFVLPEGNGCLGCLRSYTGKLYFPGDLPSPEELAAMVAGEFFPKEVVAWMQALPYFYEDAHAIYVHAGVPRAEPGKGRAWAHPSEVKEQTKLLWLRESDFFRTYDGKRMVVGHTTTDCLPPELSTYTPEDPSDMWEAAQVLAIDTGCGKGGFLTCLELPSKTVYESRGA